MQSEVFYHTLGRSGSRDSIGRLLELSRGMSLSATRRAARAPLQRQTSTAIIESPFYPRKAVREDEKLFEEKLKNQKYILSFGTVKILKGAKLIGDSIYQVLSVCPDLVWVFAGSEFPWKDGEGNIVSPKEYIREQAREYMDRVIFLGKLNQEELFPIVRHALFCVMPSRIDNLPNTCIEAMALGKVVIGTTGASFEQLIDNGSFWRRGMKMSKFFGGCMIR